MRMEILSCSMISLSCAYWSFHSFSGIIKEVERSNTFPERRITSLYGVLGMRLRKISYLHGFTYDVTTGKEVLRL